jgi:hypothetical protein
MSLLGRGMRVLILERSGDGRLGSGLIIITIIIIVPRKMLLLRQEGKCSGPVEATRRVASPCAFVIDLGLVLGTV